RSAVADLDEFPMVLRAMHELRIVPEVDVLGSQKVDVFTVETSRHHEVVADPSREERHSLVLNTATVERDHVEMTKIRRLDELRQHAEAVVGGIGRVVGHAPVGMDE